MFRCYRQPQHGEFFVCGADPAEGNDYCAAVWKSKSTQETVLVFHARMESSQLGYELIKGSTFIHRHTGIWPTIGVERNTGAATIHVLLTNNYPSLYRHSDLTNPEAEEDKKVGWSTNTATRPQMLDDLALSVRQGVNHIYDAATLKEMLSFIRHPKTGKPQAEEGTHDDLIFAEAIAWQMFQRVSPPIPDNLAVPDDSYLFQGGFY